MFENIQRLLLLQTSFTEEMILEIIVIDPLVLSVDHEEVPISRFMYRRRGNLKTPQTKSIVVLYTRVIQETYRWNWPPSEIYTRQWVSEWWWWWSHSRLML